VPEIRLPFLQQSPIPKATTERSDTFQQLDMSDAELAAVDEVVLSLAADPCTFGDINLIRVAGAFGNTHLRRKNGVYIIYQCFSRYDQIPPLHVKMWFCGRYTEDALFIYIDFMDDPVSKTDW
jgi:hypothetical protein